MQEKKKKKNREGILNCLQFNRSQVFETSAFILFWFLKYTN